MQKIKPLLNAMKNLIIVLEFGMCMLHIESPMLTYRIGLNNNIEMPVYCDSLSKNIELGRGDRKHNNLDKNHVTSQNMGDSFYHIFTTP
jgi:hypothetical protein